MKSQKILKKQAVRAAGLSFKSGKLDITIVRKFIKAFKTYPLSEAVISLNSYLSAIKSGIDKSTLTIDSATKLNPVQIKNIQKAFGDFTILQTTEKISPSLLGGIKVRIGDIIFDNSLKSKITQVKKALAA